MSDRATDSAPANPVPKLSNGSGFSKREMAAIMLKVPDSGLDWLDSMIKRSHKFKE